MPSATYGYLAAVVPNKKERTLLHVAALNKIVEGKVSISHKSPVPVRVRVGVSSGALLAFAPSNYIIYDLQINPGETYETNTIYYANNQSLIVYSDDPNTSFFLSGEVSVNPSNSGFLASVKIMEAQKNVFLYKVPANEQANLSFFVSNQGAVKSRFRIAIKDENQPTIPSANYISYNTVIHPRTFYQRTDIKVSGGQEIYVWAEDPNLVSIAAYGKFNYNVISTDFSVNGNFTVTLDSTFSRDASVGRNLTVTGTSNLKGNTTIEANLKVNTSLKVGIDPSSPVAQLTSLGNLIITGGGTIGSALSVGSNFSVASTKFVVLAATGNVSMQGTLNVAGSTSLSSNLNLLNNRVTNLANPVVASDAATKGFVDTQTTALAIALS